MNLTSWATGLKKIVDDLFNGESIRQLRFHAFMVPFAYIIFTIGCFIIFMALNFFGHRVYFPLTMLVFLSGALGGVINNYRRLSEIPPDVDQLETNQQGVDTDQSESSPSTDQQAEFADVETHRLSDQLRLIAIFQVYVTPLIGGIFGILLYAIFLTGIIQSIFTVPFLPEVGPAVDSKFDGVIELFKDLGPKTNKDALLVVLWAFVAGFSEKMVPNVLDKLAEQFKAQAKNIGDQGSDE